MVECNFNIEWVWVIECNMVIRSWIVVYVMDCEDIVLVLVVEGEFLFFFVNSFGGVILLDCKM